VGEPILRFGWVMRGGWTLCGCCLGWQAWCGFYDVGSDACKTQKNIMLVGRLACAALTPLLSLPSVQQCSTGFLMSVVTLIVPCDD